MAVEPDTHRADRNEQEHGRPAPMVKQKLGQGSGLDRQPFDRYAVDPSLLNKFGARKEEAVPGSDLITRSFPTILRSTSNCRVKCSALDLQIPLRGN
jgi:hypothetical protein